MGRQPLWHTVLSGVTRFPHPLLVFFLARGEMGDRAALLAMFLLTVDRFHVSWSRTCYPEVSMLFFATLSVLFFWGVVRRADGWQLPLAAISLILAYLVKESAVLLLVGFLVYLALSSERRK